MTSRVPFDYPLYRLKQNTFTRIRCDLEQSIRNWLDLCLFSSTHLPYCSDLVPFDYHLFRSIQNTSMEYAALRNTVAEIVLIRAWLRKHMNFSFRAECKGQSLELSTLSSYLCRYCQFFLINAWNLSKRSCIDKISFILIN